MNSKTKFIEKKINLSYSEDINSLIDEIKLLAGDGVKEVTVSIEGSVIKNLTSEGMDEHDFNEVVKMQELPEWVVYYLFKSQGTISDSKFSRKIF